MFENHAQTKPSSKECVMKIPKHFQSIKLNYFEHINIFESCKQPGIDNKSGNFISEMLSHLKIKFQVFCLQKISEVR